MKHLRIINIIIFCIAFIGCSKHTEYQMVITSAQSCGVIITYPDKYWGELESLQITHNENSDAEVIFHPKYDDFGNGINKKCLKFNVPRPNQNELEWSEDKLSARGHSTLRFKSDVRDIILRFEYSVYFSKDKELYGGSSMYVSSVFFKAKKIERETAPFKADFIFDINDIAR